LVLGSGQSGQTVVETLSKSPWIGLKIVSVLDKIDENLRSSIGHSDSVNTLIRNERVNYAILAMPAESRREFFQNFEWHAERFRHVIVLPDLFGLSSLGVTAEDIGGILGLEIKQALLQRWPQFLKRVLDLAVTIIGGSLVLPLCLLICLAIKLTSSGPVVYGQRRIGKENRHFTAWKFRTMVGDADKVLNHHLENSIHLKEEWQNNHKLRNDPRVTAVGRILRHTSLDELPQLWNVLVGEMSLVGPRPIVDAEVLKYGSRFRLYCKVRPGITGLWQVSGRNDTGYDKRVHLDEYYVRNWSVWLDIYLLGRTFKCILRGAGAY
jgi:Undecaprenyl-phosphate galactose phosphotransferase WbaP